MIRIGIAKCPCGIQCVGLNHGIERMESPVWRAHTTQVLCVGLVKGNGGNLQ
jgi:hypothetical protein